MAWKKRTESTDVAQLVQLRTGMTLEDLDDDKRIYFYPNIKEAAQLTKTHMQAGHKIVFYGDYDADGIGALFELTTLCLTLQYKNATLIAPHRFTDGYGINAARVKSFYDEGCKLLVTIDNGVAAIDAIKLARDLGMDVIILDHHDPFVDDNGDVVLPDATVLVDPHVTGGTDLGDHEFDDLCGAGIGWYFVKEVLSLTTLPEATKERVLNECLIVAGISTIADLVELKDDNRRIAKKALELIKDGTYVTSGLKLLMEQLSIVNVSSTDIAFGIAPCLNASGRIYDDGAQTMVTLLSSRVEDEDTIALSKRAKEANDVAGSP